MKKTIHLFLLFVLAAVFSAQAQTQLVTFQVQSPDSTPVYVFGSWSNWSNWPGTAMTSLGGGQYTATISMASNTNYEFLFVNGNNPIKEALNPAWPCTNANAQYTNRVLSIGSTDTALCAIWATCNSCTVINPPANVNATFRVESPDSTPVYIFGSWSNWSNWPGTPMTSIGGNQYEAVISIPANATHEYLYVNGNNPIKEALNPAWTCTNNNAQYTNRVLTVGTNDFTKCNKWALCDSCGAVAPSNINVTFAVQAPDSTPVYVFGNWSNWSNFPGTPMTLNTTTGNYEVTIPIAAGGPIEYLFVNGVGTKEVLNPAWTCTNGNQQYTNRLTTLGTADTTLCNRWQTCNACFVASVENTQKESIQVMLGKDFVRVQQAQTMNIDRIEIVDVVGKLVYGATGNMLSNSNIPVSLKANTFYTVRIKQGNEQYQVKLFMVE
ncbi:MAG: hypothetical protein FGM54_03610 [Chitinophagaceae bacterium]|nr:hypothetical protein [Chitinophagaceae bacterium]